MYLSASAMQRLVFLTFEKKPVTKVTKRVAFCFFLLWKPIPIEQPCLYCWYRLNASQPEIWWHRWRSRWRCSSGLRNTTSWGGESRSSPEITKITFWRKLRIDCFDFFSRFASSSARNFLTFFCIGAATFGWKGRNKKRRKFGQDFGS